MRTDAIRSRGDRIRLSKVVSHALRHAPWLYELELDANGWVQVDALLAGLQEHRDRWIKLTEDDLAEMVRLSDKQRYEMRKGMIRARYGHSIPMKLSYKPAYPLYELYHGTGDEIVPIIQKEGLKPMGRQYVHLSVDVDTATQVGNRKRGKTILLTVRAAEAHSAGHPFYEGNHLVWLADIVAPEFIDVEEG